jgi:Ran GTPase-activating protein (RanGAP) involved in mRNA processing and transport
MYTKTGISVSEALLSPEKCQRFVNRIRGNHLLENIEIQNTYTIGRRKTVLFQGELWTEMLQHLRLQSISLHNTNCIPQAGQQYGANAGGSGLRELSITYCHMSLSSVLWLQSTFVSHNRLQKLVLSDNGMTDASMQVVCDMLQHNSSVTYLDVSNNNFSCHAVSFICGVLTEGPDACKLSTLVLESNHLCDPGASLLAEALQRNTNLLVLNVKSNNIGESGMVLLVNMLLNNTTLNTLSLANNEHAWTTQQLLHTVLQSNTTLCSLDISMDDASSAINVAEMLQASLHIRHIQFDGVHTSTHEIVRVQQLLAHNTSLYRISFAECGLTLCDANQLAVGIGQNIGIQHVDLSDNRLCASAKRRYGNSVLDATFWDALGRNKTLQVLQLGGNMLGTESMWHVAPFLAKHRTLVRLDIPNNNIGGIGALVMLHAIARNTCLEQLDLRRNMAYSLSFSQLLSTIIKERICAQQKFSLHVHGIALFVTTREMRVFKHSRTHRAMQITKKDVFEIWNDDCHARKTAFLLLTRARLYSGTLSQLCGDSLRMILSYNILHT